MSNENNEPTGTTANVEDGILDLRPPKGSLIRQLLRLGLTFDHKDADGEAWCDYSRGVATTFTDRRPRSHHRGHGHQGLAGDHRRAACAGQRDDVAVRWGVRI